MKKFIASLLLSAVAVTGFAADKNTAAVSPSVAKDSRCFELRTYVAAPGKFEDLNKRFRDHTCKLFKKHGMELIGFWIPTDKEKGSENTLIYLLAHKSRDAAKKSWTDFVSDPEWKKAREESEKNGKLTEKVESVYLAAADYSDMK